ncbi:hypothetical protein [Citricoccus sp. CH26A]|uniref:hypothetical protein n=1 Tax=Citricoccus TaxID=169133 RepID=UPI001145C774|nr:hypothetical protein [Citricoccus sp. CH26A]
MSTLDRWYASGPIGVNTDFAEFGTAASTMGSALRHDDWDTLNLLDGRTAAGDQGPNLNLWGMSETQEAIRLATISARLAPTSSGGASSYLTFHTKGPTNGVTEMLRISGGDREQDRVVRFTAPSTVIVGAGGDGILKTRRINGKRGDNDEPEGLYLNWDTGTPVHIGGGAPGHLAIHGDITIDGDRTFNAAGQMNLAGEKMLVLSHKQGILISKAAGGGNLTTEGNLTAQGNLAGTYTHTWDLIAGGGVYIGDARSPSADIQNSGNMGCHDVFARGGVYVGGRDANTSPIHMYASGEIKGKELRISGHKKFVIDHPLWPDKRQLVHASIEGPEAGVYYRGEATTDATGCAEVMLPNYFEALVRPANRTVQVTPLMGERPNVSPLGVSEVQDGRFTVRTLDGGQRSQKFYWEVKGVRMDVEELEVEIDKSNAHSDELESVNS